MDQTALIAHLRELTDIHSPQLRSDDLLATLLNETLAEFDGEEDWPWRRQRHTQAVVAGDGSVTLPEDPSQVESVVFDDGDIPVQLRQYPDRYQELRQSDNGRVAGYVLDGTDIVLLPKTDEAGTIRVTYLAAPQQLVQASDEPNLPSHYHSKLVYGAAAKLLLLEGDDSGRAEVFANLFQQAVEQLQEEIADTEDSTPIRWGQDSVQTRRLQPREGETGVVW